MLSESAAPPRSLNASKYEHMNHRNSAFQATPLCHIHVYVPRVHNFSAHPSTSRRARLSSALVSLIVDWLVGCLLVCMLLFVCLCLCVFLLEIPLCHIMKEEGGGRQHPSAPYPGPYLPRVPPTFISSSESPSRMA